MNDREELLKWDKGFFVYFVYFVYDNFDGKIQKFKNVPYDRSLIDSENSKRLETNL